MESAAGGRSGRIRLEPIRTNGRESLHPFVLRNTRAGTTIFTDGNASYRGIPARKHNPKVVGDLPAHVWFKRIHRVFSLMKRWMMGVYHGLRARHLNVYLQEYVFRWNRRRQYRAAFDSLLTIGHRTSPVTYRDIVGRPPVLRTLMDEVRRGQTSERDAYREALEEGVPHFYAKRLLDAFRIAPEPAVYTRRKPRRPVLAKSRTAFVTATY